MEVSKLAKLKEWGKQHGIAWDQMKASNDYYKTHGCDHADNVVST